MTQYYKQLKEDPFEVLPLTFHIEHGIRDPEFDKFKVFFQLVENQKKQKSADLEKAKRAYIKQQRKKAGYGSDEEECLCEDDDEEYIKKLGTDVESHFGIKVPKNIWIMKPGENSNRGNGITVCSTIREVI